MDGHAYNKSMKHTKALKATALLIFLYVLGLALHLTKILGEKYVLFGTGPFVYFPSLIPLRLSLAFIFIWYAIEHLFLGTQFSAIVNKVMNKIGLSQQMDLTIFSKLFGLLEIAIACSLTFGVFMDVSSLIAAVLFMFIIGTYYFVSSAFLFYDIVGLGASISLFLLSL